MDKEEERIRKIEDQGEYERNAEDIKNDEIEEWEYVNRMIEAGELTEKEKSMCSDEEWGSVEPEA